MTMQSVSSNGGRRPYQPKTVIGKGRSGNYHRIHQAVLERADGDGSFRTTDVIREIQKKIDVGYSSVASTVFQWSDPTNERGVRRVRIHSPRVKASDPPETSPTTSTTSTSWARNAFGPPPETNKAGPFYLAPGAWPKSGLTRAEETLAELRRLGDASENPRGWLLIDMIKEMANLGFNAASVYRVVHEEVRAGRIEKRGARRRFKVDAVRIDPLSDPNSFKGPKTDRMIEQERGINTEAVNDPQPANDTKAAALDRLITQLVQKKLEQPETLSLIDAFIKAQLEDVIRKSLGL